MNYSPIIGLEIHCELKTKTKMFCSCENDPDETKPNLNICPICMGHPGTLPVINKKALEMVIKAGLALNSKIAAETYFERKNYFYPDLPKGYQISQYAVPLCSGGYLKIPNTNRKIRITRIHLEEDTGRLLHSQNEDYSLIDFNRAGVPLMELVTEPDIQSAKEARQFAEELQLILRYLGISDADMEKGQMRVEVNISLGKEGKLGTKVEIKNLNSFQAVEKASEYEIKRQSEILDKGEKIIQETRGWDSIKGKTFSQRIKEEANDYRYFPEPDLPPLNLSNIEESIPELPQQKRERFQEEYKIGLKEIEILIQNKDLADYFEEVASELKDWAKTKKITQDQIPSLIKIATNYLETDLLGLMKENNVSIKNLKITPENFAELITILWNKEISSRVGKDVLLEMFKTGADPTYVIEDKKLKQVSDEVVIEEIAKKIIQENPKPVEDYKKGKENALQFLIGQVMKETKGRVNPAKAREILSSLLK
ncbi:MAG TPA: Asp-tRNA(Asn)/Glu-tRNA(Gln) amidotransferase subunit GatB [Candidatus Pacearchaeota archaeon]|nr:Asp-tRNA(Asn)/Glu-tRNA(Gln) amidotransferase subunit GatB [Candidatus Pacearchaeota archaeon]HOK94073.1 Asp-tRNA(Asn)/Glu-tRNA(Gln) amidotransferase subunit GatB [Candidatus Pacearchaeota archaeon]HPO75144.1 Asp-tRNA(Asn)/Glu-tRNA(Gln) amidotransferase subunit GatB [Candidatus Pacearchaeota archaeon]